MVTHGFGVVTAGVLLVRLLLGVCSSCSWRGDGELVCCDEGLAARAVCLALLAVVTLVGVAWQNLVRMLGF